MITRAWSKFTVKSADDSQRILEGVASTPSTDRAQDIVEPLGATFDLPMPFLWQHDDTQPIGHVIAATPTPAGIPVTVKLVKIAEPGTLKDRLDEAWQSIKSGLVKGLSIGFVPTEYSYLENGGVHFQKWSWLELSAVTIPANQDASITAIKSADKGAPKSFEEMIMRHARQVKDPQARRVFRLLGMSLDENHNVLQNHKEALNSLTTRGRKRVRVEYSVSPTGRFAFRKVHFADGTSHVQVLTP